jgi:hypothetical protein
MMHLRIIPGHYRYVHKKGIFHFWCYKKKVTASSLRSWSYKNFFKFFDAFVHSVGPPGTWTLKDISMYGSKTGSDAFVLYSRPLGTWPLEGIY